MIWLQENYIVAVVGLVVAVFILWWFFGRSKPQDIAPPVEPAKPAKPLAPVKPEIIAAEPARFKPIEPKPQPVAAPPPPPRAPEPVAKPVPPAPEPTPAPKSAPVAAPVVKAAPPAPKPAAKPKAAAKPAAKKAAAKEPVAKPATKPVTKTAAKPAVKKAAAVIAEKPAVSPPPATKPTAAPKTGADNLQLLKGVGPKLVVLLNGLGVTSFAQVAAWTDADIADIDSQLGAFQGRIARDNIVDQAGYLARGDRSGFEAKYGALGSEI
ncbi:MAG: hypothetical protein Q7T68_13455 [Sphingopyxis sp.]|nr:hypothetical protein [Sphingopyxis sp.]